MRQFPCRNVAAIYEKEIAMAKKQTAKKAATKATETKAEKFERLAPKRVVKVVNDIRSLRKLANRNAYEWTPEQAQKILGFIADECKQLQEDLNATEVKKDTVEFSL